MPATSVGQIGLDLVVNQNSFNRQMTGVTNLAKKAGIALAAAFSVKKIVDFGKECIQLGSDLQEVQNVVDVTFPHMTAQVNEFAQSAAQSFGLSETMAKRYTGTFGAMAKAFGFTEAAAYEMSTTLTKLAGDVASFYNITQDEAYTKLKSVFSGETETLKDLGVVMTQAALDQYALANGYGKTTSAMTEQEKVALRYAFVQQQLSAAQGDFARTSDSWANQTRIMMLQLQSIMATIGQGLINLFTPVIKIINTVLGKLATLANAFKAFTELITGKKSSGGTVAAPVSELASAADTARAGLSGTSGAADSLADSTKGVGSAAKKAAKEMRALMGFDEINKLSSQDSSDSGTGSTGGGAGIGGSAVDYGSLAEGETVLDSTSNKLQGLSDRVKELAALFKKGFEIGFGNGEEKLQSIRNHLGGIAKSLKKIFGDKKVLKAWNNMLDSIAFNLGKVAGAAVNVGLTVVDNLVGGIDKYLSQNQEYIKKRLISIFDVSGEIATLAGNTAVAFAEVFDVFRGDAAKQCTASIIGIFSDGFLGALNLALKFASDILAVFTGPFVENKDAIKEALENTLEPISEILSTLHQSIQHTFEKLHGVYDEHIAPMFQSFMNGWTEIVGTLIDGYNTYIAPVLDLLAEKFRNTWEGTVQPLLDKGIEVFGKLADTIRIIWETTLQPFINWIAQNIMPVVAPVLEEMGNGFLNMLEVISGVVDDLLTALSGLLDFIQDIFTGDWEQAWESVQEIFGEIFKGLEPLAKAPLNAVISLINGLIDGINWVIRKANSISFTNPFTGEHVGFNFDEIGKIPYLAQGGYVKPNTPQLAMIGDNRTQGEIVAPEGKMQEMVDQAVSRATAGNAEIAGLLKTLISMVEDGGDIVLYVGNEELARAVQKGSARLKRRYTTAQLSIT